MSSSELTLKHSPMPGLANDSYPAQNPILASFLWSCNLVVTCFLVRQSSLLFQGEKNCLTHFLFLRFLKVLVEVYALSECLLIKFDSHQYLVCCFSCNTLKMPEFTGPSFHG